LWGGNILVSQGRISGLIDPACYHGDREVDFAMLSLFDHPPAEFFEQAALEPGWQERRDIYRLWPLLVHLRLFGHSYYRSVSACLDRLGA
jgi:fructosamine-3-kinase